MMMKMLVSLFLCLQIAHGLLSEDDQVNALLSQPLFGGSAYSCDPNEHVKQRFHLRGTSLGGWLVIEPWITPSLFYQFLGATEKWGEDAEQHVGIDSRTFCTALGDQEANRQLRLHWANWVTEEQIDNLAGMGVETLRVPVGDWMFSPYEPYIGCWDGALEELDRGLALIGKYNMTAIIDLHALRGSQNGLDNSGDTGHYEWTNNGTLSYRHWDIRGGDWAGEFDPVTRTYATVNTTNLMASLQTVRAILDRYASNPVVIGLEPVNEPSDTIPLGVLQAYYWKAYQLVRIMAPNWITLLHDSFRLTLDAWGHHAPGEPFQSPASPLSSAGDALPILPAAVPTSSAFMANCPNFAVDTHRYQAWSEDKYIQHYINTACADGDLFEALERRGIPIIVGEWSLATDNCILWINGFNDNVPGYPKVHCNRVRCPASYMPGLPALDDKQGAQDPFGTGQSFVEYATCPLDRVLPTDEVYIKQLANAALNAFDSTHGWFFWNFRTELPSDRWDYQRAVAKGYIPTQWTKNKDIKHGCDSYYANEGDDHVYRDQHLDDDKLLVEEPFTGTAASWMWLAALLVVAAIAVGIWKGKSMSTPSYTPIADQEVEMA